MQQTVGAGQAGLQIAARMKAMRIPALVIEGHARVGDHWRKRCPAPTIQTIKRYHTPVAVLYQPYPTNWPEYTPRDMLADWCEHYASIQELIVWTGSEIHPNPTYDTASCTWDVTVLRDGEPLKLHPSHIVFTTGTMEEPFMPDCPGRDVFRGQVLHSSSFRGGSDFSGKRVVVVGAGSSAIDACQDLVLNGAESVTMIQRSSTCVLSRDILSLVQRSTWADNRPLEVADFLGVVHRLPKSMPDTVIAQPPPSFARTMTIPAGGPLREKLAQGGLQLGQALTMPILEKIGGLMIFIGYWIDAGAAELVANGSIKVKSGITPDRFTETSLIFSDGTELPADAVIFATGYQPITEATRGLLGNNVAALAGDPYGLNAEGELNSYCPTGHPGLWYGTGDFFAARFYSKMLALQIKARQLQLVSVAPP
ncbi:hypothetical protein BN946_scf184996.g48 [Trametes cinnabarina]|uniref:FAD/NAD(P)-binding domain-containing protein n=1 Tax=Pycnoporus cinnabarinus TaxID=5643 RepID=A0A060S2K2_PYCCI|nr:hypothetical protein BN946_scf184996.g48 [Trametes cinnabarina]